LVFGVVIRAFGGIVSGWAMRLSRLGVCIPGFVTAGRLCVRTLDALVGDRRGRGSNVASADVGIERLGKSRCRDEDQNRRCGQNTFHSILLFDVTWNPSSRFPTHVHCVAVNLAGNNGLLRSTAPI